MIVKPQVVTENVVVITEYMKDTRISKRLRKYSLPNVRIIDKENANYGF